MEYRRWRLRTVLAAIGLAMLVALPAATRAGPGHSGDEGHSHDAPAASSIQSPRVIATSENFQLVGILKAGRLTIYLDRETDNSPVTDALLAITGNDKTLAAQRQADGTYAIAAETLLKPGENAVEFEVKHGGKFDLLGGVLAVPSAAAHTPAVRIGLMALLRDTASPVLLLAAIAVAAFLAGALFTSLFSRRLPAAAMAVFAASLWFAHSTPLHAHGDEAQEQNAGASDAPRRLPDGSVFLPKPTQRLLEVRTRIVKPQTARATLRLSGRVVANPNRAAIVQSTVDGRLSPVNGKFPQIGQAVKAGEVLAHVQPVLAAIDRSDVEQTAGNLDQQIALSQNKLEQYRKFSSTFPAERIKTAEIELDNLQRRRAALGSRQAGVEKLLAPVDGVVMGSQAQIGQVVTPKDVLFNIVEPRALWVEALAYDNVDVTRLGTAQAVAHDHAPAPLQLIGANPSLAQHATVLRFELAGDATHYRLGRNVSVLVEVGEPMNGIVVPRAAVVQAPNGQHIVFRHTAPEQFEPRPVKFVEIDASRALVSAGLDDGEKIVVEAATLINQIR